MLTAKSTMMDLELESARLGVTAISVVRPLENWVVTLEVDGFAVGASYPSMADAFVAAFESLEIQISAKYKEENR